MSAYEGHDLEALADLPRYQRWIVDMMAPYLGGAAVEIGAGTGNISRHLLTRVKHLTAVEPSTNLLPRLRERAPGAEIVEESAEDWALGAADDSLDTAVMVNVLEHIEDDVGVLRELRRIVRPGGHVLIYVPALPWLYSRLDERLGHYRRYTRGGLSRAVREAGFSVVHERWADALGIVPWLVVNKLLGSTGFDPRMMALYDRVFVPLGRAVEDRAAPPVGKNLFVAARAG